VRMDEFTCLLKKTNLNILFVNDGSTDGTGPLLNEGCNRMHGRAWVLHLTANAGKAEAVRRGMLYAIHQGADITGYVDADLATPPSEVYRLLHWIERGRKDVAMAARVQLLGRNIQRTRFRHYLGRCFATAASLVLKVPVYDTQCGAKMFRRTNALEAALSEPFLSRWAFDVELIGRLIIGTPDMNGVPLNRLVEMPLRSWREVGGSKLRCSAIIQMGVDLARIGLDLRRRRKSVETTRETTVAGVTPCAKRASKAGCSLPLEAKLQKHTGS
jgi:dolichyl-phosphate beta-glucosyltransferase